MLVGLHVPTNFQMYRQNSEKALPPPPPPPSGYANDQGGKSGSEKPKSEDGNRFIF